MRWSGPWRPLAQLLDDALLCHPARSAGAPHARVPTGAQGLHLQFIVASLPVAVLVAWHRPLAHALLFGSALLAATFWEVMFAWLRRRPVDEGILLTAWLFALIAPADTPLLQAVLSLSFGVVFGKAVFGGDGRYLVSPPLLALVFLAFAYPDTFIDPARWTPVPGSDHLLAFACLSGAAWLIATGSASWRIMAGAVLGLLLTVSLSSLAGSAATGVAWYGPLVSGGFAFGIVFIATDPTASAMTNPGRFAFGVFAGMLSQLTGVIFAILLASLVAPLFDAAAVALNIRRRRLRVHRQ